MNKKILNGVLLFFMLIIWALVFNKIFNFFGADDPAITPILSSQVLDNSRSNFAKDTFDLKLVERDPFLGKVKKRQSKRPVNTSVTKVSNVKKGGVKRQSIVVWPKLSYYGFVRGSSSSSELILIKVNNKLYKVREGHQLEELLIKKVFRDSVLVRMNGVDKAILKSK